MMEIAARRANLESEVLTLERQHGAALLDDKKFDMAKLIKARDELSALDAAEAEAQRREAAQEAAKRARLVEAARAEAKAELEAACAAIARLSETGKAFAADLKAALDHGARLERATGKLGRVPPINLSGRELENAVERAVCALVGSAKGGRRLGSIYVPDTIHDTTFAGLSTALTAAYAPLIGDTE